MGRSTYATRRCRADNPTMALVDPPEPLRVQDLGIPPSLVLDITLRRAMREGQTNTLRLADTLCVSPVLLEQVIEKLRHDRLVEINGIEGRSYILTLSEPGRVQASERMAVSKYAGAVPVSLDEYARVVNAQHVRPLVNRELIRRAFSDLVIGDSLLDELGPSIHSPRRHLPLRPARHRQVVDRRAPGARQRRLGARAPCGGDRRPGHHGVRPRGPRAHQPAARPARPPRGCAASDPASWWAASSPPCSST